MINTIEHINLEIDIPNGSHVNTIEQRTLNNFKAKVLEPLDDYISTLPISPLALKRISSIEIDVSIDAMSKMDAAYQSILEQIKNKISSEDFETIVKSTSHNNKHQAITILIDYVTKGVLPYGLSTPEFKEIIATHPFAKMATQLESEIDSDCITRLVACYSFAEISQYYFAKIKNPKAFFQKVFKTDLVKFKKATSSFTKTDWENPAIFKLVYKALSSYDKSISLFSYESRIVRALVQQSRVATAYTEDKQETADEQLATSLIENETSQQNKLTEEKANENTTKTNAQFTLEHAGLLLLHPFLKELFEKHQIINEDHKVIKPAKGAQILYYLATGQDLPKDYELTTEKIILGLAITEPISIRLPLSNAEKQDADALLQNVITHWEALKNSGPQFLRELFLMRKGNALHKKQSWIITIEKQAQDILMDKMPWGLGIIKLPWVEVLIDFKVK